MSFAARQRVHHQGLEPHQKRHAWRNLIERAQRFAARAVDTDGRETVGAVELGLDMARTGKLHWEPAGDHGAAAANTAFVMVANAALNAGTDRRRAILAEMLAALAKGVDALITDQADREAAASRRVCGERDD